MIDTNYKLRYLPLFYEDLEEKVMYIVNKTARKNYKSIKNESISLSRWYAFVLPLFIKFFNIIKFCSHIK